MRRYKKIFAVLKYRSLRLFEVTKLRIQGRLRGIGRERIPITFSTQKEWEPEILKSIDNKQYAVRLLAFNKIKPEPKNVLVALTVEDQILLSTAGDSNLTNHYFLSPPQTAIEICDDKWTFCEWMMNQGFESNIPPITKFEDQIDYPYILKKRVDAFGRNAHIIRERSDLEAIEVSDPSEYYKQAYIIDDHEYTCHILYKDGCIEFSKTLCFQYKSNYYVKGVQCAYSSRTELDSCLFLDLFGSILAAMDFNGICCFNYKLIEGQCYIFEINPRVGASLLPYLNEVVRKYRN
ncbi:MAG: hypothetical protein AAGB46_08210 [Verrucomicrobiota bacterium]